MNHSAADIVRHVMIELGLGSLPDPADPLDWPIFVGQEPNMPDRVMTLYDTAGNLQGRIQTTGEHVQHRGFQVMLRELSSHAGMAKMLTVEKALNEEVKRLSIVIQNPTGTDDSAYLVHSISQKSGIIPLGADQENSDRYLFTLNYTAVIGEV